MAKANLKLHNGTNVTIEGTPEEIKKLLSFYSPESGQERSKTQQPDKKNKPSSTWSEGEKIQPDMTEIVNLIKTCDESGDIEKNILDRTSIVDRSILPLYIVHEYLNNAFGLTSGDISKVTIDLGVPVATPNVANTLSGTASRYVLGDKMRKRGIAVRYKLSRRGLQYMKSVIKGNSNGK